LPVWIQEKIKRAINLEETGLAEYISKYEKAKEEKKSEEDFEVMKNEEDELPF